MASNELCKYSIAKAAGGDYTINTEYWKLNDDKFMDELLGD
ncbi:MAG: hypothetical protein ACFFCS_13500 [Candidatus Hodarchaeota archaeon]